MPDKNQDYLREWDEYQTDMLKGNRDRRLPLFMPVRVDIRKGEVFRERIPAPDVIKLFRKHKDDLPSYVMDEANRWAFPDPIAMIQEYCDYFEDDGANSDLPPCPLDISISHPAWILFHLPRKNWSFTPEIQYSVMNDPDDLTRNFEKICTLDDGNYLLLSNRHRSTPDGLKFNLHVSIHQDEDGQAMRTDIIIDPGTKNGGNTFPP